MNYQQLLDIFTRVRVLLAKPDNDFLLSSWKDSTDALREIDSIIEQLAANMPIECVNLKVLFAPIGPIQEVSLRSNWSDEFLLLAEKFDRAIETP